MLLSDFNYNLPDSLIARHPTEERTGSRLLVLGEHLQDRQFADLPSLLQKNDLLVFNNTRVIRARLAGRKQSGGRIEVLIERLQSDRVALALIRASKSPKPGAILLLPGGCEVHVSGREKDLFVLQFPSSIERYLSEHGSVPLPPYLEREAEDADDERYQTVYARHHGAVAAPTAGLHFDEQLMQETRDAGVRHSFITLHVGAGTFQSLREQNVEANRLHSERIEVNDDVCEAIRETREKGGRVVAVGTTTVRALEAASRSGVMKQVSGDTNLFIYPGFRFHVVDAMLTNFHLPESSLLMLVSAFSGRDRVIDAYEHAVKQKYRFFSYGDAMLTFREPQ